MKKWVLSFGLSLMTITTIARLVLASGGIIMIEKTQIDCEQLESYTLSPIEAINWIPITSDGEEYTGMLYLYTFYDEVNEVLNLWFTSTGIPIINNSSRCPHHLSQDNALLILEKCSDREQYSNEF